jgi:hypothetical protein
MIKALYIWLIAKKKRQIEYSKLESQHEHGFYPNPRTFKIETISYVWLNLHRNDQQFFYIFLWMITTLGA